MYFFVSTPKSIANLNAIVSMRKKYKIITGYSDPDEDPLISICLGSKVLENTLLSKSSGPDINCINQ